MILRSIAIAAAMLGLTATVHGAGPGDNPRVLAPGQDCCEPYRFVYAESWYGARKFVAPVRHGPFGDEVLLPGGEWVSCQFSCEYTLRKQTLEYLESQGAGSGSQFAPVYPRDDSHVDSWGQRQGYMF